MKSYAIDYYGGAVPAGKVIASFGMRELPPDALGGRLIGIEGMLSSFVKLHVDTWLTIGVHTAQGDKQGPGIFGMLKSGDNGNANLCNMMLDLEITERAIWINHWAHNMNAGPFDWHVGYVLYYEPTNAVVYFKDGNRT